ncbi:MAG: exodeoxyribonuclease III [Armatimonadetes bacterium RBG_16_58_9]|nr:MAG: exodeoxyribonuclease III [Armatimonadetes bacterium RBG_16_58_9]
MRIASFNANSIRSRLGIILDWMNKHDCDALCVQETKATDQDFPAGAIEDAGYHPVFWGQKAYNGVAIIAREKPGNVVRGLGRADYDQEARIIRAGIGEITLVNTYVPQGVSTDSPRFAYKLDWIRGMRDYFSASFTPDDPIVWVGDFNVAVEPIDVYDPEGLLGSVCYHPAEHEALGYAKEWGFVDVFRKHHPGESGLYTFWDYRVPNAFKRRMGWRLDHIWATPPLAERCADCRIDTEPRQMEKPSDHTFVVADFEVG